MKNFLEMLDIKIEYNPGCDCGECYSSGSATIVLPEKPTVIQEAVAEIVYSIKSRDLTYDRVEIERRPKS